MKIALIRRSFAATGGAELYLQRLIRALAERGHETHLFAEDWAGQDERVHFHPVATSQVMIKSARPTRALKFAAAAQTEIEREKFDCVFSLERTFKQDVYRAGDGIHRVWLQRRKQFAPWWKKAFIGLGAFHANMQFLENQIFHPPHTRHVIVNSEMVRREIRENFPSFPADQIHLVRNGVDVARFQTGQRAATRARFGVKDDEYLLLFVGSGWERKGLRFLLQAMTSQPAGVKLLVVGKGRHPSSVPANVIFADAMTRVEDAYAAADLFVFLPIYEPSANVVTEALAAGLPVITSSYNGASELIQTGITGEVINDPSDIAAVGDAIARWHARRGQKMPPPDTRALSLERNVDETLAILELAAREKAA